MNFVIFSRNFYPQNDAEAFCATRFASALADAGHNVHVVAAEYSGKGGSYAKLLSAAIKITRVAVQYRMPRFPYVNFRNLSVLDGDARNVPAFCRAVKETLAKYENPILVTRAMPMVSVMVGWRCRKFASKWISHLSDPVPWITRRNPLSWLQEDLTRFWLRRSFRDADATSVTCSRAIRFYRETLGRVVERRPHFVTTHIGDNKLDSQDVDPLPKDWKGKMILHSGDMYNGRGLEIVELIDDVNRRGTSCTLLQDRPIADLEIRDEVVKSKAVKVLEKSEPMAAIRAMKAADAVLVLDFERHLGYSPYLMSKFVYQVWGDKPMVVIAPKDSAKYDYCQQYPEAGLYFAESGNREEIICAIERALMADREGIDRSRIRNEFSAEKIAVEFVENVKKLNG